MKLLIRNTHKYLSLFISIQLLLWTISGIYFAFNKIENVRGEQYRNSYYQNINLNNIGFEIPTSEKVTVRKIKDKIIVAALTQAGMTYFDENGTPLDKISKDEAKELV